MDTISPDPKLAGALASRILLRDVGCVAVDGKLVKSIAGIGILDYQLPTVVVQWLKDDRDVTAIFPFSFIAKGKRGADDQYDTVAEIYVNIRLNYTLIEANGPITAEELPHVIGILGYMHAWPYFRADVQWLTTKLGLPVMVLPVVLSGEVPTRVAIKQSPFDLALPAQAPAKPDVPHEAKTKRKRGSIQKR